MSQPVLRFEKISKSAPSNQIFYCELNNFDQVNPKPVYFSYTIDILLQLCILIARQYLSLFYFSGGISKETSWSSYNFDKTFTEQSNLPAISCYFLEISPCYSCICVSNFARICLVCSRRVRRAGGFAPGMFVCVSARLSVQPERYQQMP